MCVVLVLVLVFGVSDVVVVSVSVSDGVIVSVWC